ncbi:MAG: response regulator [Planctomycetes bacterium]|nr:response regulator [Planctomycetota bacterium]
MRDIPTVLLVDDNPGDVSLIEQMFEESAIDAQLIIARSASEAFVQLGFNQPDAQIRRPDLVILDLNLPVVDGHEILARLRGRADLQDLAIVVLTSSRRPCDQQLVAPHRVTFVTKPGMWDGYLALGESLKALLATAPAAKSA